MTIAIIGATGLVGREIIKILEKEKKIKEKNLLFISSTKGEKVFFRGEYKKTILINQAIKEEPKYALFSAGSQVSLKYAKTFTKKGTTIIDNSSAFRMNPKYKLIIPEVNINIINKKDKIISNPNCSTIQMVLPLALIHRKYNIKRIVVSTYQAVTGSGKRGVNQLESEKKNEKIYEKIYEKKIYENVIPQCDEFEKNGNTKEEEKIIQETNKILDSKIKISATAVRVPTKGGHGESINIELEKKYDEKNIIELLKKQKGLKLDLKKNYKTPDEVKGQDDVYVSRVRRDGSLKNGLNMWVVADPLRKGAATNAIQILRHLINLHSS